MNINETIEKLGEEISRLSRKFELLKQENLELKEKNVSLERQIQNSVTIDNNSNNKLGEYLDQIKNIDSSETKISHQQSSSFMEKNPQKKTSSFVEETLDNPEGEDTRLL